MFIILDSPLTFVVVIDSSAERSTTASASGCVSILKCEIMSNIIWVINQICFVPFKKHTLLAVVLDAVTEYMEAKSDQEQQSPKKLNLSSGVLFATISLGNKTMVALHLTEYLFCKLCICTPFFFFFLLPSI